jgi:hypothetical protein
MFLWILDKVMKGTSTEGGMSVMYETTRPFPFPTGDMLGGQGMHGICHSGVSMMDPSRSARSLLLNLRYSVRVSNAVDHGLRHCLGRGRRKEEC